MHNIWLLTKINLLSLRNSVRFISKEDIVKRILFPLMGALFLWGLYVLCYKGMVYMRGTPLLGPLLIARFFAMIFLAFMAMLIFSNIITSFTAIYFSYDLHLLLSSPISFNVIFTLKFMETMVYSSWMLLLALSPLILSYAQVYLYPVSGFLLSILALIPFFVICSGIGVLLSLILMFFFPSKKTRDIFIVLGVILASGMYLFFRFLQPERITNPTEMMSIFQYMAGLQAPVAGYSPSYWVSQAIIFSVKHPLNNYYYYLSFLCVGAIALLIVNLVVAKYVYYEGWVSSQDAAKKVFKKSFLAKLDTSKFILVLPREFKALLFKDIRIFFRDTSQWSQILLLLVLVIVYVFNIYKLPLDLPVLRLLVSFLNIGMVGFVVAAVALRFVFPQVSLEGNSFWIIRSAPLSVNRFMWEKFWLSLIPLLVLSTALIWFSNIVLKADTFMMVFTTATVFFQTIGLTGMGIGMGAYFPRFKVDNIAQIESSMGGVLYMVFSLFYIGLTIALEALPVRMYVMGQIGSKFFSSTLLIGTVGALMVINVLVTYLPVKMGIKAIEKMDL
jgi:ABC-2 type transport system permease protein